MPKRLVLMLAAILGLAALTVAVGTRTHVFGPTVAVTSGQNETNVVRTLEIPTYIESAAPTSTVQTNATVIRVVDGDTIIVRLDGEAGESNIRFLGINTPETVDPRRPVQCFGKEASKKMKELLPEGSRVRLEEDPQADERDKYGRLLRMVFLPDGTNLNLLMVRDGYAHAYLSFPLNPAMKREIRRLESEARTEQRGLWDPATCNGQTSS